MRLAGDTPAFGGRRVESDARFYRRRANEELAAACRAVTDAARDRRLSLARIFLDRLDGLDMSEEERGSLEDV